MDKEMLDIDPRILERNLLDLISQVPNDEHFRLEGRGPAEVDPSYGVYEKDLPELRRLAVPLARFLLEHGMFHGKVVVSVTRVDVYAEEAGVMFTKEDKDQFFQESADKA